MFPGVPAIPGYYVSMVLLYVPRITRSPVLHMCSTRVLCFFGPMFLGFLSFPGG